MQHQRDTMHVRVSEFVRADLPSKTLRNEYGPVGFDSKRRKTFLLEMVLQKSFVYLKYYFCDDSLVKRLFRLNTLLVTV